MGKTNFVFDKESGTMKPVSSNSPVQKVQQKVNAENVTPNDPLVHFLSKRDKKIIQFADERTGNLMMFISGYGLDIKFNTQELNSIDKIESFLNELKEFFRKHIMDQIMQQSSK